MLVKKGPSPRVRSSIGPRSLSIVPSLLSWVLPNGLPNWYDWIGPLCSFWGVNHSRPITEVPKFKFESPSINSLNQQLYVSIRGLWYATLVPSMALDFKSIFIQAIQVEHNCYNETF